MIKKILTSLSLMAFAASSQAALVNGDPNNLVNNGSFVDFIQNSNVPTGWSFGTNNGEAVNSPDVMNETANFGFSGLTNFAASPTATPDGENWVGLARSGATQNEVISQVVSGFTIGESYLVSWYEGNFGYDVPDDRVDFTNANAINVSIGNDYDFSGGLLAVGSNWVTRSFVFQANQTSYELALGLLSPSRAYLSVDGVSITQVAAVPEPSSYAMLIAGGLMLAGFHRKKQA